MARDPENVPIAAGSARRARRMTAILDRLAETGGASLAELAGMLGASQATVRRDLADLADQQLLLRTHGGARALRSRQELPMGLRDTRHRDAKRAIADQVVSMLPIRRTVIALGGGSTTAAVARALGAHPELTIVTNSISIAQLASGYPGAKVLMTGGMLRPESMEVVGPLAEKSFSVVNVETAVLGTDGISVIGGVTTHDEIEARTNHVMITRAQRTIVVADGSKIGRPAFAQVATLDQVTTLVTDASADPAAVEQLRAAGLEVVIVAPRR